MVKLSVTEAWIAILSVFLILVPVLTQTENLSCHSGTDKYKEPLRLVDAHHPSHSNPSQGRIEVCHDNRWGTVCNSHVSGSKNFTKVDVEVACFQLGFAGSVTTHPTHQCQKETCATSGDSWMHDVVCTGEEEYLTNCSFARPDEDECSISHTDDVIISCYERLQVALWQATQADLQGKLHYYYLPLETFEAVCIENTAQSNLQNINQVVCRQLGLGATGPDSVEVVPVGANTSTLITDATCNGNEERFSVCSKKKWSKGTGCNSGTAVSISCNGSVPQNLKLLSISFFTATLSWDMSNQLQYYPVITSYNIMYQVAGNVEEIFRFTAPSTDLSPKANVTDLYPLTEYTFRVAAVFGRTVGPYSDPVRAKTEVNPWLLLVVVLSFLLIVFCCTTMILCCCTFKWNGFCIMRYNDPAISIDQTNNNEYCKLKFKCCLKRKDASQCCVNPYERLSERNGQQKIKELHQRANFQGHA